RRSAAAACCGVSLPSFVSAFDVFRRALMLVVYHVSPTTACACAPSDQGSPHGRRGKEGAETKACCTALRASVGHPVRELKLDLGSVLVNTCLLRVWGRGLENASGTRA
ncbi:MAG: hypothetical protein ACI8TX_003914, partial [Hyphomicrobiaceae bacterium]